MWQVDDETVVEDQELKPGQVKLNAMATFVLKASHETCVKSEDRCV